MRGEGGLLELCAHCQEVVMERPVNNCFNGQAKTLQNKTGTSSYQQRLKEPQTNLLVPGKVNNLVDAVV